MNIDELINQLIKFKTELNNAGIEEPKVFLDVSNINKDLNIERIGTCNYKIYLFAKG